MEPFENMEQAEPVTIPDSPDPIPQTPPEAQLPAASQEPAASDAGGRKPSPYADSPYEIQRPTQYQYQPQTQKPPKPPKEHHPSPWGRRILAALLTIALVVTGCLITASSVNSYWENRSSQTADALTQQIQALEAKVEAGASSGTVAVPQPSVSGDMTPSQIYAANADSVVAISCSVLVDDYYGTSEGYSRASGFILREDGYIVTNSHVVEDTLSIDVTLNDGTQYPAQVVGADSTYEIAVLKIEAEGLPAVTLGSSNALSVGDMVTAIGNQLGLLSTSQTVGYVSGINREVSNITSSISMLQTDVAINSGSSGGPLFNTRGEVVGITTSKYSGFTGSGALIEGITFAVPIDDVKEMLSDLIDYGYVTGAYLGVTVQDMDPDVASLYSLPIGAYVVTVEEGGAAQRAGIQPKDIIVSIGDYAIGSITELSRSLRNFKAGDEATVTVVRGGQELELSVTFDQRPKDLNQPAYGAEPDMPSDGDFDEWYDYFSWYFGE